MITYDDIETKVKQRVLVDNQGAGTLIPFIRSYVYDDCGDLESTNDTDFDGVPYTVIGSVEEKSQKIDFVDEIKENERLKVDMIGTLNIANTNACAYLNQTIEQNSIGTTPVMLELNNVSINTNPAILDTSTTLGEYIFISSGRFELELQISADTQDGARRTSKTTLQVFDGVSWVDAPNSPTCFGYHRNNASGQSTSYNRVIVTATPGQRYRYIIQSLQGLIKTVPEGTSVVIKQIA